MLCAARKPKAVALPQATERSSGDAVRF